jgi:hypothetical protein
MTLDFVIAVGTTAAAAMIVAVLSLSIAAPRAAKIALAAVLTLWFVVTVTLAATGAVAPGGFGTTGVGLAVVLPIVIGVAFAWSSTAFRSAVAGIPMSVLIGVNALRVLGVFFLILYAEGRLPAPFAPSAGWGDIIVGAAALPVAFFVAQQVSGWRPIALLWNVFGTADLIVAIGLGVASAADSPFPIFTGGPDTTLMAQLPMFIVPGFLVPLLMLTHIAVFAGLARAGGGARDGRLAEQS